MLEEGKDFYYNEEGLMVLTKSFLLKRGFCCSSGCAHCPYEVEQRFDPSIPQELQLEQSDQDYPDYPEEEDN